MGTKYLCWETDETRLKMEVKLRLGINQIASKTDSQFSVNNTLENLHSGLSCVPSTSVFVECKSNTLTYKSVITYTKAREAQHGLELGCSRQ